MDDLILWNLDSIFLKKLCQLKKSIVGEIMCVSFIINWQWRKALKLIKPKRVKWQLIIRELVLIMAIIVGTIQQTEVEKTQMQWACAGSALLVRADE